MAIRAIELPGNMASYSFSFNPMDLLKTSGIAQKVFVLALSADVGSNVLAIRAR
jgi:hypothetical protein